MIKKRSSIFVQLIPWILLLGLISITYARFLVRPYIGFVFGNSQRISAVFSDNTSITYGDIIIKFDHFYIDEFFSPPRPSYLMDYSPGDQVELFIEKPDGEIQTINWTISGFTREEFLDRFEGLWLLPYFFWLCGTITFLIVRPRDARWALFSSYNYLTAIWFAAGSDLSNHNIWYGSIILKFFVWISIPIFLNLHIEFFKKRDRAFTKRESNFIKLLYVPFVILAILEIFYIPPSSAYLNAFLISLIISIIYLIIQFIRVKRLRPAIRIIFRFSLIAFLPSLLVILFSSVITNPIVNIGMTIVALPMLPISFFFAIFNKRLGDFEFRANRLITMYFYMIFITVVAVIIFGSLSLVIESTPTIFMTGILSMFAASLFTASFYRRFQRLVERWLLGIKIPEENILQSHILNISTAHNSQELVSSIHNDFLPSLMIRQSSILQVTDGQITSQLFLLGLDDNSLQHPIPLDELLKYKEKYILPENEINLPDYLKWVRLVIPLNFNEELIGIWLFGDRAPENFYSAHEIELFKSVASTTAISMINVQQAENLVGLYHASINREEEERARLSRDIHDIPLNNLAAIKKTISDKKINNELTGVINDLRQVIRDLRPELISFGLNTALEELVNSLNARQTDVELNIEIDEKSSEIEEKISLQVFRIIQQACENALKHSHCQSILIQGQITSDFIVINVIDDGIGFEVPGENSFAQFLKQKHFGIVGMFERAYLIDANLQINSELGSGTAISFRWKK